MTTSGSKQKKFAHQFGTESTQVGPQNFANFGCFFVKGFGLWEPEAKTVAHLA